MNFLRAIVAVLSLCLFSGCYDSIAVTDRPVDDGARDAGPRGRDAAVARDSFVPPPVDAGPRFMDSGPGEVCVDGEDLGEYDGPGCAPETLRCLEECEVDPDPARCQDDCFAADFQCTECFNGRVIHCSNRVGCQDAWDAFACCAEEAGCMEPGIRRLECADFCFGELDGYSECVNSIAIDECEMEIFACFDP